jgi:hypothetical protein
LFEIIVSNPYDFEQIFEPKQDLPDVYIEEQNDISSSILKLFPFIDDKEMFKIDIDKVTSYIEHPKSKLFPLFTIIKVKNRPILENEINELIKKINVNEKDFFLNSNNNCEDIEKIRNKLKLNKKRTKKLSKEVNLIKRTKQGRKKKEDSSKRSHDRYSSDNIIKAIKAKINASLILFINKIINSIYNLDQINNIFLSLKLPKIKFNSEIIKVFKKNNNIYRANLDDKFRDSNLLNRTIKEYFSSDISIKYKNFRNDYNVLIINYLLNDDNYINFLILYLI